MGNRKKRYYKLISKTRFKKKNKTTTQIDNEQIASSSIASPGADTKIASDDDAEENLPQSDELQPKNSPVFSQSDNLEGIENQTASEVLRAVRKAIENLENITNSRRDDDEFDIFGKLIATHLRKMPLNAALYMQQDIQTVINRHRIKLAKSETPQSLFHNMSGPSMSHIEDATEQLVQMTDIKTEIETCELNTGNYYTMTNHDIDPLENSDSRNEIDSANLPAKKIKLEIPEMNS